ncbi:MAG: PocR ligand-binding domain-containing protein [Desulfobacterales bacterium]
MELTDILTKVEWAAFEKELYDRFRINCTVYNTSGVGVTGKPNWCNRICPKIKANPDSLAAICAPGNQNFMAQAQQSRQAVIGECDAGLIKIAVPIFSDGQFLGTAGGCGLLPEDGEVETFMIEMSLGLSPEKIASYCEGLATMSPEKAQEMAQFIEKRIGQIMENFEKSKEEDHALQGTDN